MHEVSPNDLVQAADQINLNAAMLDDLVYHWTHAVRKKAATAQSEG